MLLALSVGLAVGADPCVFATIVCAVVIAVLWVLEHEDP